MAIRAAALVVAKQNNNRITTTKQNARRETHRLFGVFEEDARACFVNQLVHTFQRRSDRVDVVHGKHKLH